MKTRIYAAPEVKGLRVKAQLGESTLFSGTRILNRNLPCYDVISSWPLTCSLQDTTHLVNSLVIIKEQKRQSANLSAIISIAWSDRRKRENTRKNRQPAPSPVNPNFLTRHLATTSRLPYAIAITTKPLHLYLFHLCKRN